MADSLRYTCNEYRDEMTLLALRNRQQNLDLSEEERRQIEEEIRKFEKRLGMK